MNDIAIINTLFENLYQEFKTEVTAEKAELFNAKVFKGPPATAILPHYQIVLRNTSMTDETLNKIERKWNLLIEVEVYAQDLANANRDVVANKLQEKAIDFYFGKYGFNNIWNEPIPNSDKGIQRILIRFTAQYDIDTGVISRY